LSVSEAFKILTYKHCVEILARYNIPLARGNIASSPEEAIKIAENIGYPVALKVLSPQIIHKTDAKVLKLGIRNESELISAYDEIIRNAMHYNPNAEIQGVLVQEMIEGVAEVIIGISQDIQFGPVILFGLGGIFVEILEDVSLRVPPITKYDAEEMIQEIKGYKLLEGFRGKPKADIKAIIDILLKVSNMACELRESILEMDLNPIIVREEGKGAYVVDVRMLFKENQ